MINSNTDADDIIITYLFQCASNFFLTFAAMMMFTSALKLANHERKYAFYSFNESSTRNSCKNDNQCDGQRTCSPHGWCQGTSRPAKNVNYLYDEAVTNNRCPHSRLHQNWANRNYYCDGNRTCSHHGWCQGVSRRS